KKESSGGDGDDSGASGASCPINNSFVPGTRVLMADGTTKPIEDVENGDKVLTTDPQTGETAVETVTAEIVGEGVKHLVKVTVAAGDGKKSAEVTATEGHPFWVPERGDWVDAKDLETGEWLRTSAGTYVQVTAVERWTAQRATVHNLTVSDLHTYYVLAGAAPVLVHNCGTGSYDGDVYGRMKPAGSGYEINHMPQNASTPITEYSGPAIRMDRADHRQIYSTGQGSRPEPKAWLMMQKELVASGRIDRAMMNDINDIVTRFPGKYNNAIGEMIGKLGGNAQYQAARGVPETVHVQLTLW
ncbi:polymorphic toxin-type HINT domain-containing protein, partial [Streptomyces sp. NPDC057052]|uniref:polymorphic toxin-type HINT domain-containing protein n=1 Tax=Streptomyces sp. NPDC057052 TaxID=3346010 RepID=UPI0036340891